MGENPTAVFVYAALIDFLKLILVAGTVLIERIPVPLQPFFGLILPEFRRPADVFNRRFTLPDTADAEAIEASFTDGVLAVVIPKLPQVQPRRITVKVN